jgi:hypothetical protein
MIFTIFYTVTYIKSSLISEDIGMDTKGLKFSNFLDFRIVFDFSLLDSTPV